MSYELNALESGVLETGPDDRAALTASMAAPLGRELSRLGSGLGLAAVYGLALGARGGGVDLIRHALAAPLGVMAVALVAAPSSTKRAALPTRCTKARSRRWAGSARGPATWKVS